MVVLKSGRITDIGPHRNLLQTSDSYTSLIETFESLQKSHEENSKKSADTSSEAICDVTENKMATSNHDGDSDTSNDTDDDNSIAADQLGISEKVEKGFIPSYVYKGYVKKSGGYFVGLMVLLTLAINIGCGTFSSWWLSEWLRAGSGNATTMCANSTCTTTGRLADNPELGYYQAIYGLSVGFVIITNILRAIIFTKTTLSASTTIHNELFKKVLYSPMKFFDYTPIGRILNLFTKDQEVVDCHLPLRIEISLQYFLIIAFALFVVVGVIPWMIVTISIFAVVFYFIHRIFHHAVRDIKRLQNVSWPAVFSHVATSMQGMDTIRVFSKQDAFVERFVVNFFYVG